MCVFTLFMHLFAEQKAADETEKSSKKAKPRHLAKSVLYLYIRGGIYKYGISKCVWHIWHPIHK